MQTSVRKLLILVIAAFLLPSPTDAASISFDPQANAVGTESPFLVAINIDSEEAINALSLTIALSENLEPIDVSDGNSVMHLFLDKPHYDAAKHTLTFSGIFPGGYSGTRGRLLTLTMRATKPGVSGMRIVAPSHAYLNTPVPEEAPLTSHTLSIEATDTKNNLANPILDVRPPEDFVPTIARVPVTDTTDAWMLIFASSDKGSGIDRAEVREVGLFAPWEAEWYPATSPYLLRDQSLTTRIDIRVYDKKGNVREVSIMAHNAQSTLLFGLIAVAAGMIVVIGWLIWRRK